MAQGDDDVAAMRAVTVAVAQQLVHDAFFKVVDEHRRTVRQNAYQRSGGRLNLRFIFGLGQTFLPRRVRAEAAAAAAAAVDRIDANTDDPRVVKAARARYRKLVRAARRAK